jgi:hypothetical protein
MLMTAMPFVDLTAACILTSVSYARELGVPEEKWIFPLGGSAAKDSAECAYTTSDPKSPFSQPVQSCLLNFPTLSLQPTKLPHLPIPLPRPNPQPRQRLTLRVRH